MYIGVYVHATRNCMARLRSHVRSMLPTVHIETEDGHLCSQRDSCVGGQLRNFFAATRSLWTGQSSSKDLFCVRSWNRKTAVSAYSIAIINFPFGKKKKKKKKSEKISIAKKKRFICFSIDLFGFLIVFFVVVIFREKMCRHFFRHFASMVKVFRFHVAVKGVSTSNERRIVTSNNWNSSQTDNNHRKSTKNIRNKIFKQYFGENGPFSCSSCSNWHVVSAAGQFSIDFFLLVQFDECQIDFHFAVCTASNKLAFLSFSQKWSSNEFSPFARTNRHRIAHSIETLFQNGRHLFVRIYMEHMKPFKSRFTHQQ